MMKIKKNLKYVLNIFFIVVIGWLTVRLLFRGEEFSDIVADLHLAKKSWLAVGAVCVFCYVAGESVIIKYMLRLFEVKTPFRRCLKYSFIGFFFNIAYIAGLVFIFYKPLWARKMGIKLINLLTRIRILKEKNNEKYINKIKRICDNYMIGSEYIKSNVHTVINIFLITLVQRMFLLAVTWIVYKSYGLSGTGFWNIIALQTMIGVAVEMLPLPGAAGVTEGCFTYMFMSIFTAELVKPAMLLSRGLSFYLLLIMSALVTFVAHFIVMRNDKKNGLEGSQEVKKEVEKE